MRRRWLVMAGASALAGSGSLWVRPGHAAEDGKTKFRRVATQYIAALADPAANSGGGAQSWGLWPVDPGPRGVPLGRFAQLQSAGGVAPEGWKFDRKDWWLEEHGLIMEQPKFPITPGKYLVTGDREVTTVLTIEPDGKNGDRRWALDDHATLFDVTHLRCRAARYAPAAGDGSCSPVNAPRTAFPVAPGDKMPTVAGCKHQDYAVLIVIAIAQYS